LLKILKGCERELESVPEGLREALADAVARLEAGQMLSLPLSRPMPGIGKGVHELRLKDRSGVYRIVYALRGGEVYLLHAFKKTTQQTPHKSIALAKKRLREVPQ